MDGLKPVFSDDNHDGINPKLEKIDKTIERWSAAELDIKQCGEVVRLFAGICEEVNNKVNNAWAKETKSTKEAFLKEIEPTLALYHGKNKLVDFFEFCSLLDAYRTTHWGEHAFDKEQRDRGNKPKDKIGIKFDDPDNKNPVKEIAKTLALQENTITGVSRIKLGDKSTTKKIDQFMGLPEGADISGTTADSIWCIETISNLLASGNLDAEGNKINFSANPNLLLFPIAAIVSGYHHTILECALPLCINGYIEYSPGFYTSLQNSNMKQAAHGAEIQEILKKYTENNNNHILFFYFKEFALSVLADSKEEKEYARKNATLNFDKYQRYSRAQPGDFDITNASGYLEDKQHD